MNIRPLYRAMALGLCLGLASAPGSAQQDRNRLLLTGQVLLQHPLTAFDGDDATLRRLKSQWQQTFDVLHGGDAVILELESSLKPAQAGGELGRDRASDVFHEVDSATVTALIGQGLRLAPGQSMFINANNHAGDNGVAGITAMTALFAQLGVPLAGIGDQATAAAPRYMTLAPGTPRAQRIALVAFATDKVKLPATPDTPGVNTLSVGADDSVNEADQQRLYGSLAEARAQNATVVVYQHNHHWKQKVNETGGTEQWRTDFARRVIDHGADVYFAHGEPRLQGIEIYKGKPLFYGLGNFVFQTVKVNFYKQEVWESVIAELNYDSAGPQPRKLRSIKLIPVILNEHGVAPAALQTRGLPALAQGAQARSILASLQAQSARFGTRIEIDDSRPDAIVGRITID